MRSMKNLRGGTVLSKSLKARAAICEALEDRQMLSLTIDVRQFQTGSKQVAVSAVGQVIYLQVWATVTAANGTTAGDALDDVMGSFISTKNGSGSVDGNLQSQLVPAFDANGSIAGAVQDLNGDGNLDIGSDTNAGQFSYFFERPGSPVGPSSGGAIVVGNSVEWDIGTLVYTVTRLNQGGQTDINFVPAIDPGGVTAIWDENGKSISVQPGNTSINTGIFQGGAPLVLIDAAIAPAPVAVASSFYAQANQSTKITPLALDTSVDSLNVTSVDVTTPATSGTAIIQPDGSFIYTPIAGFIGTDSFTYTVADLDGFTSNPATVTLTVGSSAVPVAGNIAISSPAGGFVSVPVLASDSAAAGLKLNASSVVVVNGPSDGTAVVQKDGSILYTDPSAYAYTDSFTYTVSDSLGHVSNLATATITMVPDVPPTAASYNVSTGISTPVDINVISSASSPVGELLNPKGVVITTAPSTGSVAVQSDGSILYTPSTGFVGKDSFKYTLSNYAGQVSSAGTITLLISNGPFLTAPIAENVSASTSTNSSVTINVLSSATPSTGASFGYTGNYHVGITTNPTDGTVFYDTPDGSIIYTPNTNYSGSDSFTYYVIDNSGAESAPATVSITVKPVVGAPVANNDQATTRGGQTIDINVLANDESGNSALVPGTLSVGAPDGDVTVQPDGSVLYTPESPSYVGIDTFYYSVKNADGLVSNLAKVTVNVTSSQLAGAIIGTSGSYRNQGNTRANVFDGNLSTFFDAPTANGNWVGLDLGSAYQIQQIKFAPRPGWTTRMVGGVFQASNDPAFKTGVVGLSEITTNPQASQFSYLTVATPGDYRYVRYLSPNSSYGNIAELQFFGQPESAAIAPLTGTAIGTTGSYASQGNRINNVFDGNLSTFYDAATGTGAWVGVDLGSAKTISQISFAPRTGFAYRMVGGMFQASNTADFSTGVVNLYTVTTNPPSNVLTTVSINVPGSYRYVRYIGPANACCNIAEMVLFG